MLSRRLSRYLLGIFLLACMGLFLLSPARYAGSISKGVSLWAVSFLPAAFPFFVLTVLFSETPLFSAISKFFEKPSKKLFRISGEGASAALMSMISGYPVGARLVLSLSKSGAVSKDELFRVSAVATTSGPAFLTGVVGSAMLKSVKAGYLLMISHFIAIYTVGFVLARFAKTCPAREAFPPVREPRSFSETVSSAVLSILCVGGFIALFYALGEMLSDLGIFTLLSKPFGGSPTLVAALRGLLEMTTGCSLLSQAPSPLSVSLCAFLVTFGGICVLMQQLAFLTPAGIRPLPFLAVKFSQGVLAFGICFLLTSVCGI